MVDNEQKTGLKKKGGRAKKERGVRQQHQVRAYDDEWELIKRFSIMVKYMGKLDDCRKAVEILERTL